MHPTKRNVLIAVTVVLLLGLIYYNTDSIHHRAAQRFTSGFSNANLRTNDIESAPGQRVKACFVILARNSDLGGILNSMQQIESAFNKKFNYPWVFLNDEPFNEAFIASTSAVASSNTSYGIVPHDHWLEPDWIDPQKAARARQDMAKNNVIYGDSQSYRRMCRFYSGFFFRHPLLADYDYYWRVDPSIKFFCQVDYDPFLYMHQHKKKYGFTVTIKEYKETIPTLWETTMNFTTQHPEYLEKDNSLWWVSDNNGDSYNLCHFWSNFEIGSLAFLRSKAYLDYFEHLDRAGGFSYERWGDAPVHSLAAALFLKTEEIHFFRNTMGYRHEPFQHCPQNALERKCFCDPNDSFEDHWYSCTSRWKELLTKKGIAIDPNT